MSINVYTFSGNIGRDAEVGATKGGTSVCRFSVAVSSGFGDKEVTTWVECSIFGKRAEGKLPQYLKKGSVVVVSGEPTLDKWVGKDGTERTSLKVLLTLSTPSLRLTTETAMQTMAATTSQHSSRTAPHKATLKIAIYLLVDPILVTA